MYTGLLHTHSLLRYFILIALTVVIIKSLLGWLNNKPYTNLDGRIGLYLLIFTHLQFVVGVILYFVSPVVQFTGETMKVDLMRYWAVEHVAGMLVAVVLITAARVTSKKMPADISKHRRMFIFNAIAMAIILGIIALSDRRII